MTPIPGLSLKLDAPLPSLDFASVFKNMSPLPTEVVQPELMATGAVNNRLPFNRNRCDDYDNGIMQNLMNAKESFGDAKAALSAFGRSAVDIKTLEQVMKTARAGMAGAIQKAKEVLNNFNNDDKCGGEQYKYSKAMSAIQISETEDKLRELDSDAAGLAMIKGSPMQKQKSIAENLQDLGNYMATGSLDNAAKAVGFLLGVAAFLGGNQGQSLAQRVRDMQQAPRKA
jgi:hypothetical protein